MKRSDSGTASEPSFWKENTKPLPGKPSSDKYGKSYTLQQETGKSNAFQEFDSVNDVWDVNCDELYKVCAQKNLKQELFLVHSYGDRTKKLTPSEIDGEQEVKNEKSSLTEKDQVDYLQEERLKFHNCSKLTEKSDKESEKKNEQMFTKITKFKRILSSPLLNLEDLRHLSWSGVPEKLRPTVWKLLAGYLPASSERRELTLERKRTEYWNLAKQYFSSARDDEYEDIYRQIHIDIPRMSPLLSLFNQKLVQEIFERILFIWAIRHPASGYVQGMNDLVTPFFVSFLLEHVSVTNTCIYDSVEISQLPKDHLDVVEADSFWCFSKFLEGIQDNYIFAQLGIQQKVIQLKELVQRVDNNLHQHLEKHGIDYIQFSFRWINNLLIREIPLKCCIRLWDTYLAEINDLATFQLYVSAAFLLHWRHKLLLEKDFQGLIMFLQNLPTNKWSDSDVSMLVAEAYKLKFTFADAPSHLLPHQI